MNDYTERDMLDLIHATWRTFPAGGNPQYVVAEHVPNGAGFGYSRLLDAIIFDTWPSTGLALHGIEVKVSKADFRKELADRTKSAAFCAYLDYFSIAAPKGIVTKDELPHGWGLYVPDGDGRLRAVRKPLMLHDAIEMTNVDRSLMAAFARALVDRSFGDSEIRKAEDNGYQRGLAEAKGAGLDAKKLKMIQRLRSTALTVSRCADALSYDFDEEQRKQYLAEGRLL